jgi:hypothetical protein
MSRQSVKSADSGLRTLLLSGCLTGALLLTACGTTAAPGPTRPSGSGRPPAGVSFAPIDGGPSYFASKSPHSAWMDGQILLGAWLEQPQNATEVGYDAAMGENIYWNLAGTPGKDRADYNVIRAGGLHAAAPDTTSNTGSETVAHDGWDEADGDFGPGTNGWNRRGTTYNQSDCIPSGSQCGYTVSKFHYTGRPSSLGSPGYPINGTAVHQGFGKGVLFWETAQQAARFLKYTDILSADSYWMTDSDLQVPSQGGCALLPNDPTACGGGGASGLTAAQAELPANYGWDVTRLERLQTINGPAKPVVVDVETGCPGASTGNKAAKCITPPSMVAAAWHGLIAGARGILWFQHNFSGPCQDLRTFVDGSNASSRMHNCQQTPGVTLHDVADAVTAFDHQVHRLNRVLLSSTARGYVSTPADVSTLAKVYGGACYVFAGAGRPATPSPPNMPATFSLADRYSGQVTVVDENRTVQATNGSFTDMFADMNAVHIYRIGGGSTCTAVPTAMVAPLGPPPRLSVWPKDFRASARGPSLAPGRGGTTVSFTRATSAPVTFDVDRADRGEQRSGRCLPVPRSPPRYAVPCTRFVRLPGAFRQLGVLGRRRFHFTGWLAGRMLSPARYRLDASWAGSARFAVSTVFRVVP